MKRDMANMAAGALAVTSGVFYNQGDLVWAAMAAAVASWLGMTIGNGKRIW